MRLLLSAADPTHPFRPSQSQRMPCSADGPLPPDRTVPRASIAGQPQFLKKYRGSPASPACKGTSRPLAKLPIKTAAKKLGQESSPAHGRQGGPTNQRQSSEYRRTGNSLMSLYHDMHRSYIRYVFLTGVTETLVGEGQRTQNERRSRVKPCRPLRFGSISRLRQKICDR
jgi:hypothetical protein